MLVGKTHSVARAFFASSAIISLLAAGLFVSRASSATHQDGTIPPAPAAGGPMIACSDLRSLNFLIEEAPTQLQSATMVPATSSEPEYCRVAGYVWPQVHFELRLPTDWNGRYMQTGGGGFGGNIPISSCDDALAQHFAVAANDMGHSGGGALWGRDNEQLRIDYAHRSTHVLSVAAKEIVGAYYGERPSFSYFRGCSTGGREGVMQAARYPDDFDGIIAGHPASPSAQGALGTNWLAQVSARPDETASGTDAIFTDDKADFLAGAVMDACDGVDGLVDGIIDDPRNCDFDPATLLCPGPDAPDCLTEEQVTAARKLYDGARNSRGLRLYPGWVPYGTESIWDTRAASSAFNATEQLRHLQFRKSPPLAYTYLDFDFDTDATVGKLRYGHELYDPFDPDLTEFEQSDGKLLLYHGWLDNSTSSFVSVDYYSDVAEAMGGPDELHDWFRLFMIPGMGHCGGRIGDTRLGVDGETNIDMGMIVNWVENRVAPDQLIASYFDEDENLVRTRPVFPYPQVARYDGSGSIDDAANFVAADPPVEHDGDIKWLFDPPRRP